MLESIKSGNCEYMNDGPPVRDLQTAFQSSSPVRNTHFSINKVYTVTVGTSSSGLPGKINEPDNV